MSDLLLEVTRGDLVEERHRGDVAVVDRSGALVSGCGDPDGMVAYWRSSAKPFQAMPLVYTGAAHRFGFDAGDLALCCASHSGEPEHTARVAALLERIGCAAGDLVCGSHPPLHAASAAALSAAGQTPTVLHSNCSGKHTGMLALARHMGAPIAGYTASDHPVQQEILENVSRFTGVRRDRIVIGVDGCGAPTFGISVTAMAAAFARLADPTNMEEPYASAAVRVRDAMVAYPYLVAGTGRFDTAVMTIAPGLLVAKGGASGVQCVGLVAGLGFATKLEAGPRQPGLASAVILGALEQLGCLDAEQLAALAEYARPAVTNVAGARVGETRVVFAVAQGVASVPAT
ncbi:MAG: asparaginase [Chloroflexota bacterium]|nr:asparaginase [Chloroflexota bacterium]